MSTKSKQEVCKTTSVVCQLLVQNLRSDQQVKYQSKKAILEQLILTPLVLGLFLAIHSRVRHKNLVHSLSDIYIGCEYRKIIGSEKCLKQGILQPMNATGRFCLPDFVKKGVNCWSAADNINILKDNSTGQKTSWHNDCYELVSRRR